MSRGAKIALVLLSAFNAIVGSSHELRYWLPLVPEHSTNANLSSLGAKRLRDLLLYGLARI